MLKLSLDGTPDEIFARAEQIALAKEWKEAIRLFRFGVVVSVLFFAYAWHQGAAWMSMSLYGGGLILATQAIAWAQYLIARRDIREGRFGAAKWQAKLIGDEIARAQRTAETAGPSSSAARQERFERFLRLRVGIRFERDPKLD
ncbi:MAG TPA: hypothetical protein VJL39_00225 [Candidatus Paceibacterota bacterium]